MDGRYIATHLLARLLQDSNLQAMPQITCKLVVSS